MKKVGIAARLLIVAVILSLAAFAVVGCGGSDEKKQDTVSTDASLGAGGANSGGAAEQSGQTKQFESGEKVGKAGKVVVESDADMSAEQQAVIARLGEFADVTKNQNYKKLCNDLLAKAARKIGGNCVKTFSQTGAQLKDFKITVKSVKIGKDGKSAVAKVVVSSNVNKTPSPQDLSMIKEDGDWRIQILGN